MDKRELIIPARFDYKDAVAGLKSIEDTGHVAGDLEHAADAASARFRQAHESIKLASQGYLELRRALRGDVDQERRSTAGGHTIDEAGEGGETNLTPKEWRESGDEFRSHAGGRFGGPMTSLPGEHTGEDRHAFYPPYDGAEHSPGQAQRPGSGMPASPDQERVAGGMAEFALAESRRRGLGGGSGLNEGMSRIDQAGNSSQEPQFREARSGGFGAFPDKNRGLGEDGESRGAVQGPAYQGIEPRESGWRGPLHREASVDLTGWARSDREGGRDGLTSPRRAGDITENGVLQRDPQAIRHGAEQQLNHEAAPEGLEAREGIRRMRTSFSAPAGGQFAEEQATGSRGSAGISPGGKDPSVQLGGAAAIGVIERLLREQNELIRQDLQRNVSPPIAAPPPMRGGGIRMGS